MDDNTIKVIQQANLDIIKSEGFNDEDARMVLKIAETALLVLVASGAPMDTRFMPSGLHTAARIVKDTQNFNAHERAKMSPGSSLIN